MNDKKKASNDEAFFLIKNNFIGGGDSNVFLIMRERNFNLFYNLIYLQVYNLKFYIFYLMSYI